MGRYLACEVQAVQVLHSINDRHWQLNQILDPHTANAPINALPEQVRPYISGAKLAGAGGGGFLVLLAKTPDDARDLRQPAPA